MKKPLFRITIINLLFILVLSACVPTSSERSSSNANDEASSDPLVTNELELEPERQPKFTIQSAEEFQASVAALYEVYYPGESPVFVASDADLLVTNTKEYPSVRPLVYPTYLPDVIMIPQKDLSEVEEFINFALSPEGQQVLIDARFMNATIVLTDQAGNDVEIIQPIRRVISSYGPATSFVYSTQASDRLVSASYLGARDPLGASIMGKMDSRFPGLMGDDFFTQEDFNVEQAASLNPDLIITSARTTWMDTASQLDIPVFLFDAETPEGLKEAMLLTGKLFGPHPTALAQAWVDYYDGIMQAIQTKTAGMPQEERVRVLFTGTSPLRVASGDMYQTILIEAAGGISVSSELGGHWNDINLEQVAIWDPEVIIVPPYGGASVEAIIESPEWQILEAVQQGHVYRMPKLVVPWDTPAPDSVLGVIWLAQLLYSDEIGLSCEDEADFFYNTFYDYPITLEEINAICQLEE